MAQSQEFTLSPAFQAVASTGVDLPSLLDTSPDVSRKPRLLVPIDVQPLRDRCCHSLLSILGGARQLRHSLYPLFAAEAGLFA